MRHKNALQIILTLFVLANSFLYAQVDRIELGDKYFEQFAYEKAITLYKGAVDRGEKDWKVYAKLGDCFYYTSDSENAVNYYRLAFKEKSNNMDLYRLRFAQSLISSEGCDNAISSLDSDKDALSIKVIWDYFLPDEKYNKDPVVLKSKICKEKEKLNEDIIVDSLSINTKASDFGGVFSNGILYFTSSRKNPYKDKKINKRRYNWNDQPYLDIYEALLVENSDSINSMLVPIDVSKIGDSINNSAHQSGVTISRDTSKIM